MACDLLKRSTVKCVFSWFFRALSCFLAVGFLGATADASSCQTLLSRKISPQNATDALIAYLNILFEQRTLEPSELASFATASAAGKIINPFGETQAGIDSDKLVHRQEIARHLQRPLDVKKLAEWANALFTDRERAEKSRSTVQVDTSDGYSRIVFQPIYPNGKFKMGGPTDPAVMELTHPFEMMSTPVTQKQWTNVMGVNLAYFSHGPGSLGVMVNNLKIRMRPDNPMEWVNWWSAIVFANSLSEKAGLKPAYDLSGMQFKSNTHARAGNLQPVSGTLKINAPNEDIYLTEGYRLPTEAEMDYVLNQAAIAYGADLPFQAWHISNSPGSTQPVGEFKPFRIGKSELYDLFGNVWEWTHDGLDIVRDGVNRHTDVKINPKRVYRGGAFDENLNNISFPRNFDAAESQKRNIGFRLVRTLK